MLVAIDAVARIRWISTRAANALRPIANMMSAPADAGSIAA
jgi:hypothetical protein